MQRKNKGGKWGQKKEADEEASIEQKTEKRMIKQRKADKQDAAHDSGKKSFNDVEKTVKDKAVYDKVLHKDELNLNLSPQQLKEAIVWSEVLGKPRCKTRNRRMGRGE